MDKQDFVQRFQYQSLEPSTHRFKFPRAVKESAVLIPLCQASPDSNELSILLTKRASHLKHHPGQVSFPGGKVEESDESKVDTALREAEEEIGLARQQINVIGQLRDYHTITGFNITPIIGLVEGTMALDIDHNEVAQVFTVPLTHFINRKNHTKLATYHRGFKHFVHFIPYQEHQIWGATAAIIADLVAHLSPEPAGV